MTSWDDRKIDIACELAGFYFSVLLKISISVIVGYTKDSMKIVNLFRSKERYEQSPETQAIVNAKYQ